MFCGHEHWLAACSDVRVRAVGFRAGGGQRDAYLYIRVACIGTAGIADCTSRKQASCGCIRLFRE